MNPQIPAKGISLINDYGGAKWYRVPCHCGCDAELTVEIEVDDNIIAVNQYSTQKTNWWKETVKPNYKIKNRFLQWAQWTWSDLVNGLATRIRLTWGIWVHGYIEYESTVLMDKQQALNFAEVLKTAIADVETYETDRKIKQALNKLKK